jgi:hypothetical protein
MTDTLDQEAYNKLALEIMMGKRVSFPSTILVNEREIEWAEKRLPEARKFVETVEPPALRRECDGWIKHSEYCIREAKQALAVQRRINEFRDKYMQGRPA